MKSVPSMLSMRWNSFRVWFVPRMLSVRWNRFLVCSACDKIVSAYAQHAHTTPPTLLGAGEVKLCNILGFDIERERGTFRNINFIITIRKNWPVGSSKCLSHVKKLGPRQDFGSVLNRVSSKQTKINFGSNRNKPKQDLFRVCFGLFRETKNKKFRFVSNLYRNNRNKQNCFFRNRNKPKQP